MGSVLKHHPDSFSETVYIHFFIITILSVQTDLSVDLTSGHKVIHPV